MVGRLLVITGASGVGKSTLSARIAASLEFDKVVATDTIRETLRTQISQNEDPALHRSSFQPGESNAIEDWKNTTTPLNSAIEAIVQREMKRGGDLLMEGVHFVPNFSIIDEWRASGGEACGVVLAVEDAEEHVRMIAGRRKHNGRSVRHYLDHIERIREIQFEMVRLAEKSGWVVIDVTKSNDPIGEIF
ncbi:MAG: AAA family ATPase, partial [Candidatus Thermoplasmatota archaeon]|nr:AAA family ATPase [Candidatus Thermoplasmatota archaeon]